MKLELRDIRKRFGDKQVLKGVSFKTESGKAFGLLGRNGAGKTTTIRILMDVFSADQGEVLVDGDPTEYKFIRMGYLPEERGLYPKKKIIDQLVYFAMLKGMTRRQAVESVDIWLKRLGMSQFRNKRLGTLSKGNQQKIQLITALAHDPDVIILDEPFSGLDPVNTEVLKQVIFEEKERGATIIFSDHVMTNVEELCDELVMIRDGSVILSGPVQEVRNSFGKTRLFVSNDFSKEELEVLPHVTKVTMTKQGLWKLVLDDETAGPDLFDQLTKGRYLATFDQQAPTIDEIFKLESGVEV